MPAPVTGLYVVYKVLFTDFHSHVPAPSHCYKSSLWGSRSQGLEPEIFAGSYGFRFEPLKMILVQI